MTRDILDKDGNVTGQLTLPDETSEQEWAARLAQYTYVPAAPSLADLAAMQLKDYRAFGMNLLIQISANQIQSGITSASNFLDIITFARNVQLFLSVGQIPACLAEIDSLLAEGIPPEFSPYVTTMSLTATRAKVAAFLGVP